MAYYILCTIVFWLVSLILFENVRHAAIATLIFIVVSRLTATVIRSKRRKRYLRSNFTKERIDEIENLMKQPKAIEISEYEERIRRNLIFSSFLAISFAWFDLKVDENSTFFGGLKFANLQPNHIYIGILAVIIYEFTHYFWIQMNHFAYWRVRLTGTSVEEVRGNGGGARFGNANGSPLDYTGTDENSNFYTWMLENKRLRNQMAEGMLVNSKAIDECVNTLKEQHYPEASSTDLYRKLSESCDKLVQGIKNLESQLESIRTDASMLRFDEWYSILIRSQNIRWLLLDISLPFFMGLFALILLTYRLIMN